jgi:putative ABC transport system permease protein
MLAGRFFTPGLDEIVVGKNAESSYAGLDLGSSVEISRVMWKIVGIFDAGGSAFDSELWCDATLLDQAYNRPPTAFQSITVRLPSPADFPKFKDVLTSDPRLTVSVDRERDYYAKQSETMADIITALGSLVAIVMGIGAVFGALNTMYSAVSERSREVATLRALGFSGASVVLSFVFEALFIAFLGGLVGCIPVGCIPFLPLSWITVGTLNFGTFSHVSFSFRATPALFAIGIAFALFMGFIGGVPPAIRAARRPIAVALREL